MNPVAPVTRTKSSEVIIASEIFNAGKILIQDVSVPHWIKTREGQKLPGVITDLDEVFHKQMMPNHEQNR